MEDSKTLDFLDRLDDLTILFLDNCINKFIELDIEFLEANWLEQKNPKNSVPALLGIMIKDHITSQTSKVWISRPDVLDWAAAISEEEADEKMNEIIADITFDLEVLDISDEIPPEELAFLLDELQEDTEDQLFGFIDNDDGLKISLGDYLDANGNWTFNTYDPEMIGFVIGTPSTENSFAQATVTC